MFFHVIMTQCFFDKLRAVKRYVFTNGVFNNFPPNRGSYQKSVKADPAGGRLEVFFEYKLDGFIFKKLRAVKTVRFYKRCFSNIQKPIGFCMFEKLI